MRPVPRGMTIFDLFVTVTLLGLLATAAAPAFSGFLERSRANDNHSPTSDSAPVGIANDD